MKKTMRLFLIVIVSLLTLASCKKDLWERPYSDYVPDTFSFTEREMEVEVHPTTTSFFITAIKDDMTRRVQVGADYSKSSALINKHYKMPKMEYNGYGFLFPVEQKSASFEVTVVPENITESVVIVFCNNSMFPNGNSNPEKFIDTLRVKLVPVIHR